MSRRATPALLVLVLLGTACSGDEVPATSGDTEAPAPPGPSTATPTTSAPAATSQAPTTQTAPTRPPPTTQAAERDDSAVTTTPADITVADSLGGAGELARGLYTGDDVAMDPAVAEVLTAERRSAATGARRIDGATGTWGDTPIAVLTSGGDVTLAAREKDRWRIVGGWWPSLDAAAPVPSGTRTVLLVGSDARSGEPVDRARADAIQLVASDGTGAGGVLGIARDSWVEVPGHGHAKVNAALAYGGPDLLVRTVEGATDLEVDGYLLVGFEGFKGLLDDLGGLPIVLDAAQPAMWADLPEGLQRFTGAKALAFARERQALPDGDIGRSRHQGEMVLAALDLGRELGPEALPELMTSLSEHAQTDLDATEALTLLARLYTVDPDRVGHGLAQGPVGWSSDGQSIIRWDDATRGLLEDLADGRLESE